LSLCKLRFVDKIDFKMLCPLNWCVSKASGMKVWVWAIDWYFQPLPVCYAISCGFCGWWRGRYIDTTQPGCRRLWQRQSNPRGYLQKTTRCERVLASQANQAPDCGEHEQTRLISWIRADVHVFIKLYFATSSLQKCCAVGTGHLCCRHLPYSGRKPVRRLQLSSIDIAIESIQLRCVYRILHTFRNE